MNRLHVDSVRKKIGDRSILNDVFISCQSGEIVGLLGRNGAGKSSLFKIVFGSLAADYKFVSVNDRKTRGLYSSSDLIHYLPQHRFLPEHIKIADLISCFCRRDKAALLMKQEWIQALLIKKAKALSTGERRMVECGILLFSEARFLLLDEPFNGIAPLYVDRIKELIRQNINEKGTVITGQDYKNVIDLSSRIILMQDGNTREIKNLEELVEYGYLRASADLGVWVTETSNCLKNF